VHEKALQLACLKYDANNMTYLFLYPRNHLKLKLW